MAKRALRVRRVVEDQNDTDFKIIAPTVIAAMQQSKVLWPCNVVRSGVKDAEHPEGHQT